MTFFGVVVGSAASIAGTWLAQRYALTAQLAVKRTEAKLADEAAFRAKKEERYLAILSNLDSLYLNSPNQTGRADFLRSVREVWLLGDQDLVCKIREFLVDIAGKKEADDRERLFGDVVLQMRTGLGLPTDALTNKDFRHHSA